MATLEKRVQVLFDPERYQRLEAAARESGVSVGAYIRDAVDERLDSERNARLAALEELFARVDEQPADYPALDWEAAKADSERELDPRHRIAGAKREATG